MCSEISNLLPANIDIKSLEIKPGFYGESDLITLQLTTSILEQYLNKMPSNILNSSSIAEIYSDKVATEDFVKTMDFSGFVRLLETLETCDITENDKKEVSKIKTGINELSEGVLYLKTSEYEPLDELTKNGKTVVNKQNVIKILDYVRDSDKQAYEDSDRGYYKTYFNINGAQQRVDLGDGLYYDKDNEELLEAIVTNNLKHQVKLLDLYLNTGEVNWAVDLYKSEEIKIEDIVDGFKNELTKRKNIIKEVLKIDERDEMKKLNGNIKVGRGVINLQPTLEQWNQIKNKEIEKKDLSPVDMIDKIEINGIEISKINYQIVSYDQDDHKKYSNNLQALGNEATAVFKASQNNEVVKVILNEREYTNQSGNTYKSYSTIAVENISQNKENLLDMTNNQEAEKELDIMPWLDY